ncbi:MAG: RNA polymerase sigma-70 factor [Prolixibacteraceae bacterium]|jgi:RNA polymerase sigma-70 factor (ECF subfamily)|nr:RNA polymerase sigma-70 factor [Prolixibacteraceae bacterium]
MERTAQQEEWFREVFRNNYIHLRNYLYYLSGDIDWSEDAVQEIFLMVWEKRGSIRDQTLKSFLFKAGRNLFLKKKRHEAVTLKFARQVVAKELEEIPEYHLEQEEFSRKLQNAISELPNQCRTIFLMNRMDNMKYQEIADALRISLKAVEKQISKALRLLREKLDDIEWQ